MSLPDILEQLITEISKDAYCIGKTPVLTCWDGRNSLVQ